ncbi:MAG: hypothetical protein ACJ78Q_11160 [Chloroflexia bacterium]
MQRIDERGKFFTERISKGQIDVLITTINGHVRGFIYLSHGQRVKDMLNTGNERFIAVSEATASSNNGSDVMEADLMAVNKDHIVSVVPIGKEW